MFVSEEVLSASMSEAFSVTVTVSLAAATESVMSRVIGIAVSTSKDFSAT
jgi:hypothetical protein